MCNQTSTNDSECCSTARLVFNEPKRTHITPLFISLHWLPVAANIKFKSLMLAYRSITGSAPAYFHSLLRVSIPSRSLWSVNERRLVVLSQRDTISRTFSFTVPCWWNDLLTFIQNAEIIPDNIQKTKTHLFSEHLTSSVQLISKPHLKTATRLTKVLYNTNIHYIAKCFGTPAFTCTWNLMASHS